MAIVNVTYGHQGSGKLYSYNDPTGKHRTGDEVVVPVTHPKSKKTYRTLAVIKSTHATNTAGERSNKEYLEQRGIGLKSLSGVSQKTLPGYYPNWGKDARTRKELEYEYQTLPGMTERNFRSIRNMIRRL